MALSGALSLAQGAMRRLLASPCQTSQAAGAGRHDGGRLRVARPGSCDHPRYTGQAARTMTIRRLPRRATAISSLPTGPQGRTTRAPACVCRRRQTDRRDARTAMANRLAGKSARRWAGARQARLNAQNVLCLVQVPTLRSPDVAIASASLAGHFWFPGAMSKKCPGGRPGQVRVVMQSRRVTHPDIRASGVALAPGQGRSSRPEAWARMV